MYDSCLVALDIDGTLIPVLVDFDMLRVKIRELLGVNHPLRPLGESLASLNVGKELLEIAWSYIEKAELESVEKLDPGEVAKNVEYVMKLLSMGMEVVFVTARSTRTAELVLSKLGLLRAAKSVISRDSSPHRVEQLRYATQLAEGKQVVFVGDTTYDEESARLLGIPFIRVRNYGELPGTLDSLLKICGKAPHATQP